MSLVKRTYVDGETVITAENLNDIQDAIIENEEAIEDQGEAIEGKYTKPSGGIPASDLASGVQTSLGKADTAYQKPSGGIPSTDLASGVQTSLGKADTALQSSDIDNTLTVSGKAADAKKTGDEISGVKNTLRPKEISVHCTNGSYIASNGTIISNEDSSATDFIPVTSGRNYTLLGLYLEGPSRSICGYGADQTFIRKINSADDPAILNYTVPPDTYFLRATGKKDVPVYMVEDDNFTNARAYFPVCTDEEYVMSDGNTASNANSCATDFIPVAEGELYLLENVYLSGTRSICSYDARKRFIAKISPADSANEQFYYTVPTGTKYLRATGKKEQQVIVEANRANTALQKQITGINEKTPVIIKLSSDSSAKLTITEDCILIGAGFEIDVGSNANYAVLISGDIHVDVYDLIASGGTSGCVRVESGANVNFYNCTFQNSASDGLQVVNASTYCVNCIAQENGSDGFNYHNAGNNVVIGCYGLNNGDDGISNHDTSTLKIIGGKWIGNTKAGIACPTYGAGNTDISNVFIKDNPYGLYILSTSTLSEIVVIQNAIIINATNYGAYVAGYQCYFQNVKYLNCAVDTKIVGGGTITVVE